jgi:hypothetical protein
MTEEADLRKMEWQWHCDLDPDRHSSRAEVSKSAALAFDWLKGKYPSLAGYTIVIAVVKNP